MFDYDYNNFPLVFVWPSTEGYIAKISGDDEIHHYKCINDVVISYCLNYQILIFPEVGVFDEV